MEDQEGSGIFEVSLISMVGNTVRFKQGCCLNCGL